MLFCSILTYEKYENRFRSKPVYNVRMAKGNLMLSFRKWDGFWMGVKILSFYYQN